jgi:phage baseplate assembly protein gpV
MKSILIICLAFSVLNAKFIRDNAKQVVLDIRTNLIWQDDRNSSEMIKTWSEAIEYCENSTLGEYNDWHLPNFNELYYLANREKNNLAIDIGFVYISNNAYWSSTTFPNPSATSDAWVVRFSEGSGIYDYKSNSHFVRCVRDEQ